MTLTPPALVEMLPPTWLEPLEAKSTGQVRPWGSQCLCTASVTAPACTRTVCARGSTAPIRLILDKETTSSPSGAPAPPAKPVLPPEGTTRTRYREHSLSRRATSSVERGKATADGLGAWTLVQSFP